MISRSIWSSVWDCHSNPLCLTLQTYPYVLWFPGNSLLYILCFSLNCFFQFFFKWCCFLLSLPLLWHNSYILCLFSFLIFLAISFHFEMAKPDLSWETLCWWVSVKSVSSSVIRIQCLSWNAHCAMTTLCLSASFIIDWNYGFHFVTIRIMEWLAGCKYLEFT